MNDMTYQLCVPPSPVRRFVGPLHCSLKDQHSEGVPVFSPETRLPAAPGCRNWTIHSARSMNGWERTHRTVDEKAKQIDQIKFFRLLLIALPLVKIRAIAMHKRDVFMLPILMASTIKPRHNHPGWCASGGSHIVQVPWSFLHGDGASRWRNRCANQLCASDPQSTVYLAVAEATHKRPHLLVSG